MPVHWVIDSRSRRVVVTAEGKVTRPEFEAYLEAVTGAGANPFAKLAIVVPPERRVGLEPVLGALAAADRPVRLFTTLRAARRWIDSLGKPAG
jgi:hypothetical protein